MAKKIWKNFSRSTVPLPDKTKMPVYKGGYGQGGPPIGGVNEYRHWGSSSNG